MSRYIDFYPISKIISLCDSKFRLFKCILISFFPVFMYV